MKKLFLLLATLSLVLSACDNTTPTKDTIGRNADKTTEKRCITSITTENEEGTAFKIMMTPDTAGKEEPEEFFLDISKKEAGFIRVNHEISKNLNEQATNAINKKIIVEVVFYEKTNEDIETPVTYNRIQSLKITNQREKAIYEFANNGIFRKTAIR